MVVPALPPCAPPALCAARRLRRTVVHKLKISTAALQGDLIWPAAVPHSASLQRYQPLVKGQPVIVPGCLKTRWQRAGATTLPNSTVEPTQPASAKLVAAVLKSLWVNRVRGTRLQPQRQAQQLQQSSRPQSSWRPRGCERMAAAGTAHSVGAAARSSSPPQPQASTPEVRAPGHSPCHSTAQPASEQQEHVLQLPLPDIFIVFSTFC